MTYKPDTRQMTFVLPLYFTKAELVFTKAKGSFDNISFKVYPDSKPSHAVSTEKLGKGFWTAHLLWTMGKSQFCDEKLIEIA